MRPRQGAEVFFLPFFLRRGLGRCGVDWGRERRGACAWGGRRGMRETRGNEGRARQRLRAPVFRTSEGSTERPEGREHRQRRQCGKGAAGRGMSVAYGASEKSFRSLGRLVSGLVHFFLFSGAGGVFHHLPALPAIGAEADPESVKIRGKSVFRHLEGVRVLVLKGARVRPAEGGRKAPCAIFPVIPTWCRIGV